MQKLDQISPGERSTRPVTEAIDEPKSAEREEQRQLLREDAPDLQRQDDEVVLGVSREVPRPAGHLRPCVVGLSDIDAHVATVGIGERQRLPRAPYADGFGQDAQARVEDVEGKACARRQVSPDRSEAAHQVLGVVQVQQGVGRDEHEVEGAAHVEVPHVAVHPLHPYSALVRLVASLGQHVR